MKKIATVTFHMAWNYGAILQTYALQKVIEDLGYESEVWDYDCRKISVNYQPVRRESLFLFLRSLISYIPLAKKDKNFRHFVKKYIRLSAPVTKENQESLAAQYDAFVVGSDQVWNYRITGGDPAYFLSFAPARKRLSYAASLGLHGYPDEWKALYRDNLKDFARLSVREQVGADVLKDLIQRDATVDIDPVFLLSASKWKDIMAQPPKKKKYVFIYMPGTHCMELARKLAEKENLEIVNFAYGISLRHPEQNKGMNLSGGPDEFLTSLYHAEYIVTGSFHATVFSLIFHKKFLVEPPPTDGGRIPGILGKVGLLDHLYTGEAKEITAVDWQRVDQELDKMRARSLKHLKENIESVVQSE